MSNIDLSAFGSDVLAAFIESPDILVRSGQTVPVQIGAPSQFRSTVEGQNFDFKFICHSARLTRVTQIINTRPDNQDYNLVTGVLSRVKADLLVMQGDREMSINEFFLNVVNSKVTEDKRIDLEQFNKTAEAAGFYWGTDRMAMMWQHFGASQRKMDQAFDALMELGAYDDIGSIPPENRGRIQRVVAHDPGLIVDRFEVGQNDRTKSKTGQGFLDLLEAAWTNFMRVITLRTDAWKLQQELDEAIKSENMTEEEASENQAMISSMRQQAGRWVNNWGGAQERITVQEDGEKTAEGIWDQVSVPCGRITVLSPKKVAKLNPDTNEPVVVNGSPVFEIEKEPVMQDGEVLLRDGQPLMQPVMVKTELDFWRAAGDTSDVPGGGTGEIDTTVSEAITGSSTSSATKIEDTEEDF